MTPDIAFLKNMLIYGGGLALAVWVLVILLIFVSQYNAVRRGR